MTVKSTIAFACIIMAGAFATEIPCATPSAGKCSNPTECHYENYFDASTGETTEECRYCPGPYGGSSVVWDPSPRCLFSNVKEYESCDPAWIAWTSVGVKQPSAACFDQCKSTGIQYKNGNPVGCNPKPKRALEDVPCSSPSKGSCSNPSECHYENYFDASSGKTTEECLYCPGPYGGSSVVWDPSPRCLFSNVKQYESCDPAWIAWTSVGVKQPSAACFDQCKSTGIQYKNGNPVGCNPKPKRALEDVPCSSPSKGSCSNPSECHYENYFDASTGKTMEECLYCPGPYGGSSVVWDPTPRCLFSNVKEYESCDPAWIAWTSVGVKQPSAACFDQCESTGIQYENGNPVGCNPKRRLRSTV